MRQENIIRNITPTLKDLSIPDILGNFKNERDYLDPRERMDRKLRFQG